MSQFVQGRTDRLRWCCRRSWAAALFGAGGLRVEDWLAAGRVEVVKYGPHRTVYWVEVDERQFYVKHYRCRTIWDRLRHLIRRSPARREWARADEIAARGIATIGPVAWQEVRGRGVVGDSYLVTEAVPESCTLQEYHEQYLPRLASGERRQVLRQLVDDFAGFAAGIHQAGVRHDDFHPGNVLVSLDGPRPRRDEPSGRCRLTLIDVAGVRCTRPLEWKAVRASLAVLNAAWARRLSRADRYRFWRGYLAARPDLKLPPLREALGQLDRASTAHYRYRLRRRDQRTLRSSQDYVALQTSLGYAHGVADLADESLRQLAAAPEALLLGNLDRPVKLDRGSMIVEAELPLGDTPVRVAYKRYRPKRWWKALLAPLRPARAVRGWQRGHALALRGIPAARPVVAVDRRRPWYRAESYLAVEWISGSENLHLYLWRLAERPRAERMRRANRYAAVLGSVLGKMHRERVLHGDLKASNLLVTENANRLEAHLVDVDDVRLEANVSLPSRARDLARLAVSLQAHPWVSRTTCLRFVRSYIEQFGRKADGWRLLWRAIAGCSERITARKRRKKQAIL